MTLKVFISYKSEYRDFARAVKSELNQWGFDTWLDVDNIQPGDYFRHKIQQGLDSSDVLLMVLTEEAQLSREVMSEVDYFLDVAKKPVVPLLHRECKPLYIFVSIQYIDFIKDQANGFVHLKQKLNELASSIVKDSSVVEDGIIAPPKPAITAPPDSFGREVATEGEAAEGALSSDFGGLVLTPEPEPAEAKSGEAETDETGRKEREKKEAVLDDLLSEPASEAAPPRPQPVPPPPPQLKPQVPAEFPAAPPAANAPVQPTRQQPEYMPQPAMLGRKKSRPIFLPLAAVASLVIVVGAVMLISNSNATLITTSQEPQGISPLVWVGVAAILGVIGVIGWQRFGRQKTREGLRPSPTEIDTNRATMLQKVEDFWLKGVLDPALEAGSLDIGLSAAPGAVLRHKDYGDYALPANANILDVFNDLNRELLILGAPGGGKTVLLLQLARELIKKARNPHLPASSPSGRGGEEPIPVVFNLSSWAAERKPLADWLVDELRQKYQVPKKVSATWVEREQLLLLLDGLDEVAEQYRNECVDAINTFRQQYRTVDLAICSRAADYDALTSKLDVRGAIVLEPLSQSIVDAYLDRPELASLQQVMATDAELREMSEVPFLLNAMAYAYVGATSTNLQFAASDDPAKARRTHLFDRWVEKRLAARPSDDYTPSKVQHSLGWLAKYMGRYREFYIKDLHLKPTGHYLSHGNGWGLIGGLKDGWAGFEFGMESKWHFARQFGLVFGLAFGLAFERTNGLTFGLVIALIFGITNGIRLGWPRASRQIRLWRKRNYTFGFTGVFTLLSVFIIGTAIILTSGIKNTLVTGLVAGLVLGLASIPEYIWQIGLKGTQLVGLTNSIRRGIAFGLASSIERGITFGIVFGITGGLAGGLIGGLIGGLASGWSGGWSGGIFGSRDSDGFRGIQNLVFRIIVWRADIVPWNYERFLDYCVRTSLMRSVGEGYIFVHRYLMEYFAENYAEDKK